MYPESQPERKKWPLSPKKTILLVVGLVGLIVIIMIIALLAGGNKSKQSGTDALYHDRAGYDRQKLGDGVADPFAIKFTPVSTPTGYEGKKVVQACNLLTVDDLTSQDLLIKANTLPTPISRTFNDGVGKAGYSQDVFASSLSGASLNPDTNSCHYVLQSDGGAPSVTVNVFQPFSMPSDVIDEELQRNYSASGTISGLELFTKKPSRALGGSEDTTEYIAIKRGEGAFYLSLTLPEDKPTKKQSILDTVADNFVRELASPSGLSKLTYDSPIFPKSIVRACDLLTNEHIRALAGRDAGPLAREGIATAIANTRFSSQGDQTSHLNIDNECTRGTIGGGSGLGSDGTGDLNLIVETITFLEEDSAKSAVRMQQQNNPNNQKNMSLPDKVGDESVGYTDRSNGHHLVFAKDRVVVDIKLDQFAQRVTGTTTLSASIEKLLPIAQSMANKIQLNN